MSKAPAVTVFVQVNAIRAHMAEFGVIARVGLPQVTGLLALIADPGDDRIPPLVRTCLEGLARQLLSLDREIAKTMESAGVTANFHVGATELYRVLEKTPFAAERRDTVDPERTLRQSLEVFARHLPGKSAGQ